MMRQRRPRANPKSAIRNPQSPPPMITPAEALRITLDRTPRLGPVEVPLADAAGAVLAESVASDLDLPPFDKSARDGYAARSADLARLPADLAVIEDLPAGLVPTRKVGPGQCAKIMTGAPVPAGADLVVLVEDTEPAAGGRVRIRRADARRPNICPRGEDVRRGAIVLEAGSIIGPAAAGLLASVGRQRVRIFRRPRVAILATGDELVPPGAVPGPGQIRNANSAGLLALCAEAGVAADDLGVARDNEPDLRDKISAGLERDLLVVSGGVSVGERDLVPAIFREFGVTVHFATIRQRPGKPTIFATRRERVIFGLPGNPVSTIVGFHLYVRPAIRRMMGHPEPAPPTVTARLAAATEVYGDRTAFLPATLQWVNKEWTVTVLETRGSADLVGLSRANALAVLEPGDHAPGESVRVVPLAEARPIAARAAAALNSAPQPGSCRQGP